MLLSLFLTTRWNVAVLPADHWVLGVAPGSRLSSSGIPAIVLSIIHLRKYSLGGCLGVRLVREPGLAGQCRTRLICGALVETTFSLDARSWKKKEINVKLSPNLAIEVCFLRFLLIFVL